MPVPHRQLTGNAILDVENDDIVRLLHLYHKEKRRPEGVTVAALDPSRLGWCAGKLMVLRPVDDHDFEYVYYGPEIEAVTGFNMVGRRVSDFSGAVGDFFRNKYLEAIEPAQPIYTIHRSVKTREVNTWERLILPVAYSRGSIKEWWLLVYNKPLSFTNSLVQKIIDETNDAIAYIESFDEHSADVGAYFLTIYNRTYANWFSLPSYQSHTLRVRTHLSGPLLKTIQNCAGKSLRDGADNEFCGWFTVGGTERYLRIKCSQLPPGLCLWLADETEKHDRERQLTQLAMLDPLTRVFNRRALSESFEIEREKAASSSQPIHIAVMDVDHFKRINDRYGHDVGDDALQQLVDRLRMSVRDTDYIARLGGEEFAILMPKSTMDQAQQVAERIRLTVARNDFFLKGTHETITVCLGVATAHTERPEDLKEAIRLADKALYQAKANGRNQVVADRSGAARSGLANGRLKQRNPLPDHGLLKSA